MGSTGHPGGVWATNASCAESRRQLEFCKQSWCPLYNLFTGALGGSGRGASGMLRAERICLVWQFPCPGKALQAGTCTPSCTAICLTPPCFPGVARHGMPDRVLGLHAPCRSLQCLSWGKSSITPSVPPGVRQGLLSHPQSSGSQYPCLHSQVQRPQPGAQVRQGAGAAGERGRG